MKVWITCFVLLFAAAEFLDWVKHFSLPMPVFILGGVFLAIASNADKLPWLPLYFHHATLEDPEIPEPPIFVKEPVDRKFQAGSTGDQPISFTIRRPSQTNG